MRRSLLAVGLMLFVSLTVSAAAVVLKVTYAQEVSGRASLVGRGTPGADISWEGVKVTTAVRSGLRAGYFAFVGDLPTDCTGVLSDGTTSMIVEVRTVDPDRICNGLARVPQTGAVPSRRLDDGALRVGVILPTPRFTDNVNGTITDNLTDLIWLKKANCGKAPAQNEDGAYQFVAELNLSGSMLGQPCGDTSKAGGHQTDWRLPNIRELGSLIHYGYAQPAISSASGTSQGSAFDPFNDLRGTTGWEGYYSSTRWPGRSDVAWGVTFGSAPGDYPSITFLMNTGNTSFGGYVLAVRGGIVQ